MKDGWVNELVDSEDVMEIFAMEDYVEDTLEVKLVLSEVGHPVSQ